MCVDPTVFIAHMYCTIKVLLYTNPIVIRNGVYFDIVLTLIHYAGSICKQSEEVVHGLCLKCDIAIWYMTLSVYMFLAFKIKALVSIYY